MLPLECSCSDPFALLTLRRISSPVKLTALDGTQQDPRLERTHPALRGMEPGKEEVADVTRKGTVKGELRRTIGQSY